MQEDGGEALFVLNDSSAGPNGEEIARYTLGGEGELFTSEAQILADLGRTEPEYNPTANSNGLAVTAVTLAVTEVIPRDATQAPKCTA